MPFKKGHKPPKTAIKKGQHLSPKTEFKKGHKPVTPFKKGHKTWNKGKEGLQVAWNKGLNGYLAGENHYNWRGGKSFEPYSVDWTETLRRAIRERDHYICQKCSEYGNAIHHIDYDKKNCNPDNLITLCRSCNSKVNQNRKYWTKYFQNKITNTNIWQ